jgi:hypothetical protein
MYKSHLTSFSIVAYKIDWKEQTKLVNSTTLLTKISITACQSYELESCWVLCALGFDHLLLHSKPIILCTLRDWLLNWVPGVNIINYLVSSESYFFLGREITLRVAIDSSYLEFYMQMLRSLCETGSKSTNRAASCWKTGLGWHLKSKWVQAPCCSSIITSGQRPFD